MHTSSVGTRTTPDSCKGHGAVTLLLSHDHSHFLGFSNNPSGAPVGPVGHAWKLPGGGPHERLAVHLVEGVAKVDLQQTQLGRLSMLPTHVAKGMGHYLNPSRTPDSVIAALEECRNLLTGS